MKRIRKFEKKFKKTVEKWRQFLGKYKLWLLVLTFGSILREIFLIKPTSDSVILFWTCFWILSAWICRFKGKVSFGGGLVCLTLCPILLVFKTAVFVEKAAAWAFLFFVVGVGQMSVEYLKEKKESEKK